MYTGISDLILGMVVGNAFFRGKENRMLAFYPRFIRTFDDLPGHVSLLIHAWNGCNMRCYGCHNHDELIAKKPDGHLTAEQVIERLGECNDMFDAVLFSGGEFMMNEASEISHFLNRVRKIFKGKIIVFTNGTFPRKLQRMLADNLVDGVHIDMKLPYHCLDPEDDRELFEAIIGTVPTKRCCRDILESVETVIRHNSRLSQVRTVRYPLLSDEYFERIQEYVNGLKTKYDSVVPYFLNPFHPPQVTR
ncbi:radical SAM protein [uncultured Paenibacillus sp.]|uniref:radical SAM protein n=1 Tax=uncultured Paenibacillus sp. TaxID=227322 RepID=UPI0028D6167D|nr:radical SAM protein [uncultured Paenibacillus sp.]